jgi:hypothetical protein
MRVGEQPGAPAAGAYLLIALTSIGSQRSGRYVSYWPYLMAGGAEVDLPRLD